MADQVARQALTLMSNCIRKNIKNSRNDTIVTDVSLRQQLCEIELADMIKQGGMIE